MLWTSFIKYEKRKKNHWLQFCPLEILLAFQQMQEENPKPFKVLINLFQVKEKVL